MEYKLIKMCEVGYDTLHIFKDKYDYEDFLKGEHDEVIERSVLDTGETHLYICEFSNNYLVDVVFTVFAPINISPEEREEYEFTYDWDIDTPFGGTTESIQRIINGKKWFIENYGEYLYNEMFKSN